MNEIPGWFDFDDIYRDAVAEATDGSRFVEIGAWLGKSTAFLAQEILRSGKSIRLDVVDTWEGSPGYQPMADWIAENGSPWITFERNMREAGVLEHIHPLRMPSTQAASQFCDGSLDFVFIDADHAFESVLADIDAWLPKLKTGGVLAGHNYSDARGVQRAVNLRFRGLFETRGVSWQTRKLDPFAIPIYCVTCRELPEREIAARRRFVAANVPARFVTGIHGVSWQLQSSRTDAKERYLVPAHVALGINHWWLWQLIAQGPDEEAIILEDDAYANHGRFWRDKFRLTYAEVPGDWDIVYLGYFHVDRIERRSRHVAVGYWPVGTHAYMLRREAARRLGELLPTIDRPIDLDMIARALPQLNHYLAYQPIFGQLSIEGGVPSSIF